MRKLKLDENEIINLYQSGLSSIKIAKINNCSDTTIQKILHKNKIKARSNKEYRTKYSFNHNFFSSIDTEEKAYWLGFMYADGNVRKNKNQSIVQVKVNDEEIITKFIQSINGNMPVKFYKNWAGKTISTIHLTSDQMYIDLCNAGCIPNKSLILKFPNKSIFKSNELIRHFIRGYFDGDGGISCYSKIRYSVRKKQRYHL